ncbi:Uu.00g106530.m01.CDS01 [Anthostomella pinea]|uniref:Uu.00g106530.m01.CDS01 n=1 Tax=Anthostomella pinea TaxID=933095 RepID=A0AAI8VEN3_9PEZI|nr:Uu.00g106530.m01.CDS01 [Anthostomella pinea]
MPLRFASLDIPAGADFHVHLRDGAMKDTIVPTIRQGGVNQVYVMPNLVPPVTTVARALEYKAALQKLDSSVDYLMTLYLHETFLERGGEKDIIREAKEAGIVGVKSYPAGVTTNSASGVLSYEPFYLLFEAMQEAGLVLNLHGECPSDHKQGTTILNAESKFLPTLISIHQKFPKLKIYVRFPMSSISIISFVSGLHHCLPKILDNFLDTKNCTTAEAVQAVRSCGDTVVGTITAHHLFLTVDDWAGDVFCYCKPVAKLPHDRLALLRALLQSKVLTALEEAVERGDIKSSDVTPELLQGFLSDYGRKFYGVSNPKNERITLRKGEEVIIDSVKGDGLEVVPFRRGKTTWSVEWK